MDTRHQLLEASQIEEQHLTQVETLYSEGHCNYRLLFGHPVKTVEKAFIYGQITKKVAFFKPGDIFALDLWERNEYWIKNWAVYVLQAIKPGQIATCVPQVKPAAKVLLEARGKSQAQLALKLLSEIERRTDPTTLCPTRFLLTDFRVKALSPKPRTRRTKHENT